MDKPGINPRLAVLAVVLAVGLAAVALWWLTGPEPTPREIRVVPGVVDIDETGLKPQLPDR